MVYQESSTPSKVMEKQDEKDDEKVDASDEKVDEQARRMVTCVLFFCLKSPAFQTAYVVCDFCNLQVLPSLKRQNAFVEVEVKEEQDVKEDQEVEESEGEGEGEKKIEVEEDKERKKRKAQEILQRCSRIRRSGVLGFIYAHKYCTSNSQVSHSSYAQ